MAIQNLGNSNKQAKYKLFKDRIYQVSKASGIFLHSIKENNDQACAVKTCLFFIFNKHNQKWTNLFQSAFIIKTQSSPLGGETR